jgi:polyisoprenyl-teichoic acid--peptidoglycan teichoic acid transferase
MHEFQKQTGRGQRQTVDGFLKVPSRQDNAHSIVRRKPRLDSLRDSRQTMNALKRPQDLQSVRSVSVGSVGQTKTRPSSSVIGEGPTSLLHMTLPGSGDLTDDKKRQGVPKKGHARRRGKLHLVRRWSFRTALILTILVLTVGGFLTIKTTMKLHKVLKGGGTAAALQANVKPQLLKGEGDGRINFLLLGIGGEGHDGPDLTDTMLVASIDPVNKTAALVSIPRDLWVTVPGYGQMKINAVYANAKYHDLNSDPKNVAKAEADGLSLAEQEVTQIVGIPIHYHLLMDFQAFKQAVDAVGGVDVNVTEDLVDPTMAWENNWNPVLAKKGVDHMGGVQALQYVRSRHSTARGDFDRTERQRLLIEALSQKVLSAGTYTNPLKISELISAFGDHVTTDLGVNDALRLMSIAKNISAGTIKSIGLADPPNNYVRTDTVGSASVVRPTAGFGNYTDIQNFIRNTLKDPYIAKENAAVEVLNGTSTAGLASTTGDKLKTYGYNVTKVDSTPTSSYQKTLIVDLTGGKKPYTKNYLEKRFGVQSANKLPDPKIQATGADFVVILGQDATTNSQN